MARLAAKVSLLALGGGGFVVAVAETSMGTRGILRQVGGFCASGGAYVIAHTCPSGPSHQLTFGMLGMFVAGALLLGAVSWVGGPVLGVGLTMWAAVFGLLGFDFLTVVHGSMVTGVIFELMAIGGLVPALWLAGERIRRGGDPPPSLFPEDRIVRAKVRPGV